MASVSLTQNIKWAEPYVSKGLNQKLTGLFPAGVYHGFNVVSNNSVMKVIINHDTDYSKSVAVVERNGYNLTITMDTEGGEVEIPAAGTWYVCIEAFYAENQSGNQNIVVKDTPSSHHVILAKVTVPSAGSVITSAMIDTTCKERADLITRESLQDYTTSINTLRVIQRQAWSLTTAVALGGTVTFPNSIKYKPGHNLVLLSYLGANCHLGTNFIENAADSTGYSTGVKILFDAAAGDEFEVTILGYCDAI